ncbi:hypothetical protein [Alishewanella jeotgali]|uniref:Uncharacterized protein n=1 Tax=Alishewanella jeotgali KCTC 22429 TaxID=1129374 RepID=H3ZIF6_9ALTE|nr:hypothetical protein [Alishewanella jeotgali]EHR39606.1 hypothetical protein AJE_15834 [Alishewanella jeotgali KCTC 22429]
MSAVEQFTIRTDYTINYTTRTPVPIPDIIESLRNIEKLLHRTPAFLEKAYQGIQVVDVNVYVETLQAGSLLEKFIVEYVVQGQENYDKAKEVIAKMVKDSTAIRTVVAIGVGAALTYGVMKAVGGSTPTTHVEAYNNTIVNIGADVKLSGEDISLILEGMKDKKQLAKEAIAVVKPAKADPAATIEIAGQQKLTINNDFVRETPDEYTPPIPEERDEFYTNLPVLIYASDRDKSTTWAGTVPGLIDRRTSFHLDERINPAELHGKLRIYADVRVTSKYNKTKKTYEPKLVTIQRVINSQPN